MIIAKIYFAGVASLALFYCIYAISKFDRYDWFYSVGKTFFTILFMPLLWPIAILNLRVLFDMDELFPRDGQASAVRARDQFEAYPSPCGAFVKYRGSFTDGELLLPAAQAEELLRKSMFRHGVYRPLSNEELVYKWLRGRDPNSLVHGELPKGIENILGKIAHRLARSTQTPTRCVKCNRDIAPREIVKWSPRGSRSSIRALVCPAGHKLIVWRTLSGNAGRDDPGQPTSGIRRKILVSNERND